MGVNIGYKKRIIDKALKIKAEAFGAIQIIGPKGCGKTRTAKEKVKTVIEFQDEDKRDGYLSLAQTMPSSFLSLPLPILFDEWQDAPKIWGTIRKACDDEPHFGDFYLTGSSSKIVDTPHTGTGRISTISMYTLSLYESGDSNGKISLKSLFDHEVDISFIQSDLDMMGLFYVTCRGGWPRTFYIENKEAKLLVAKDYYDQICQKDVSSVDGVKRNPDWTRTILKSYARNAGILAKMTTIKNDVFANHLFSEQTFDEYVAVLKKLFVISDLEAWTPQIRSKNSIRKPIKHLFYDPSIATAALNVSPQYFLTDFDLFGHIFESLVYRDLLVYSQSLGGVISHYHDAYNLEADFVLHLRDGRYALIEVKFGSTKIDEGIKNLLKIKELIKLNNQDKNKLPIREPDLLLIITGSQIAYEKDGVQIIPIACLKD